MRGLGYL
jgi:hypothetical protein